MHLLAKPALPQVCPKYHGTGCFAMTNTGEQRPRSDQRLLATVAYRLRGQTTYALEGNFVAGVAIKWLRDQLNLIADAAETQAAFERCNGDAQGVFVVQPSQDWAPPMAALGTRFDYRFNVGQQS